MNGAASETPRTQWGFAALLGALSMVSPFSIDTFFPSFHAIAREFSLTPWEIQQTLTVYLVPLAFMSLIQGPLSDSIGRRPVVLAGLTLYSVASVGCALAPNFATLESERSWGAPSSAIFTAGRRRRSS
jgi:MFS transporter, DHA1 family, multidrug resistance protein